MALKLVAKIKKTPMIEVVAEKAQVVEKKEKTPPASKGNKSKLPPDTYKDEIEPLELEVEEGIKLVFSVKRKGEDGLPYVDIRTYVENDVYQGFTKKGINFSLEQLLDFVELAQQVNDECEEKGLYEEFIE